MPVMPSKSVEKITFCETRADRWTANAVAIGTTPAAVADVIAKAAAARDAYNAQQQAINAAEAATATLHQRVAEMSQAAQSIINQVHIKAGADGDGVYALALIPTPAAPSPIKTLGMPTNFKTSLDATGVLTLTWKCTNPVNARGTTYLVRRRLGPTGEFTRVANVGKKFYVDADIPAGTAEVWYRVQAVRSTGVGPVAQTTVYFGGASRVPAVMTRLAA